MVTEVHSSPPVQKFDLGVLMVHGIGTPPAGDTLVRWGDVMLKTIRRATQNKVEVDVERAAPENWAGMNRLEAVVRLSFGDHTEEWLLREGWWADTFPLPSYRELVSWTVRALPWAIVTFIGRRFWLVSSLKWYRRLPAQAWEVVKLIIALLIAPFVVILLLLTLVVWLLPIPWLRTLILEIQSRLTATVGDSVAFVESPMRAALVRTCILGGLARLKQVCRHTVIIAHSQGAAVALDALGGIIEPGDEREAEVVPGLVPDALVTFGAGTNQLASQKVYSAGLPEKFGTNPVTRGTMALFATTLLVLVVPFIPSTFENHLRAAIATIFAPLVGAGFMVLSIKFIKDERIAKTLGLGIFFVTIGLVALYSLFNLAVWVWIYVIWAAFSFATFASSMLSDEMKKVVAALVRRPPGLVRWDDIYASADPVPNGPTMPEDASDASIRIWNQGSLIADHTAYWANIDEFVLRVARVCAETAQSPWTGELPRELNLADKRAEWRVGFLCLARWSAALVWLVLAVLIWRLTVIPVLVKTPDLVPTAFAQVAHLIAYVALALWLTLWLMLWPWNAWVRKEQEAVLARVQPDGKEDAKHALIWVWFVVWALVIPAFILLVLALSSPVSQPVDLVGLVASYLHGQTSDKVWSLVAALTSDKVSTLVAALMFLMFLISCGACCHMAASLTAYILLKLRPPPGAASSTGH